MMQGLVMYSGQNCPGCVQAKRWMEANGVRHQVVVVDGNMQLVQQLMSTTGQRTVPQFFLNGQWLSGGFGQVQQLHAQGQV